MDGNKAQKTIPTVYNMSSSKAREVLWALEELAEAGIKYKVVNLRRRGAETDKVLRSHFPLGKSPTVTLEPVPAPAEEDGGEGGSSQVVVTSSSITYQILPNVLTETRLILQFISDHYAPDGIWIPESEQDRRRATFFQEFANSSLLVKVDNILTFDVIPTNFLPFPFRQLIMLMVRPIRNHFMNDLTVIYQILEDALSSDNDEDDGKEPGEPGEPGRRRPWFSGPKLGLADFNMIFPIDMAVARRYIKLENYPKLARWHHKVVNRPAYKRALDKGGPYDLARFA